MKHAASRRMTVQSSFTKKIELQRHNSCRKLAFLVGKGLGFKNGHDHGREIGPLVVS
jgi:hypothetical protein